MKSEPPKHRERVYSCRPLVAPPSCPLIVLGTTMARGSRATGGTMTAMGGTTIARVGMAGSRATGGTSAVTGGTTMAWDSRATGGTTMATGGTTMAWDSGATGGMTTVTVGTMMARGSRVTGDDGDPSIKNTLHFSRSIYSEMSRPTYVFGRPGLIFLWQD